VAILRDRCTYPRTMSRHPTPKLLAIGVVVSFALAACTRISDNGAAPSLGPLLPPLASSTSLFPLISSSAQPPATASGAPVPTASATASAPGPPTTARLTAITLQPTDLPAGWVASAFVPDPNEAAESAALARCTGGHDTRPDETGEANSPDYSLDNASVSSEASSYKSQADIDDDVAIIHSANINSCFEQVARSQLAASVPAGSTIATVSIAIKPGSGGGPSNVVATGTAEFHVTVNGALNDLFLNIAFITGPLTEASVDFANVGAPVPANTQAAMIAKIAARAAAVPTT
jgi:hypothetical protein